MFLPAIVPSGLSADEKCEYLRYHYRDRFDFTDSLFVREADTMQMLQAYAQFVAVLSERPTDVAAIEAGIDHRE